MDADGNEVLADPHGNNLAFCCSGCGHPVLAVALANQRGSDEAHPAICRGCGVGYFLAIRPAAEKLYIQVAHAAA